MSHGLQFLVSYTYSRSFDDTSGFENSSFGEYGGQGGGYGGSIRASNPYCFPGCDYGASVFDAPQRLVISYVYQIPGLHGGDWWLDRLTQGWTISGITTFQEGFPVDIADLSICWAAARRGISRAGWPKSNCASSLHESTYERILVQRRLFCPSTLRRHGLSRCWRLANECRSLRQRAP